MENTLYLHVIEPPCTEELVRQLLNPESAGGAGKTTGQLSAWAAVRAGPSLRIGVVPTFALTLAGEPGIVPAPCEAVLHLFGDECRTIDEDLVEAASAAQSVESPSLCETARPEEITAFLREHMGKKAVAHAWPE